MVKILNILRKKTVNSKIDYSIVAREVRGGFLLCLEISENVFCAWKKAENFGNSRHIEHPESER